MDLYPTAGSQFSLPVPQSAMKLVCKAFNTLVGQFSFSETHTNGIKIHFLLAQNIASECQRNKPVPSESDVIFIELHCQLQRVSHPGYGYVLFWKFPELLFKTQSVFVSENGGSCVSFFRSSLANVFYKINNHVLTRHFLLCHFLFFLLYFNNF